MSKGWKGVILSEASGTCDLTAPDGRRFRSLSSVMAAMRAHEAACSTSAPSSSESSRAGLPRRTTVRFAEMGTSESDAPRQPRRKSARLTGHCAAAEVSAPGPSRRNSSRGAAMDDDDSSTLELPPLTTQAERGFGVSTNAGGDCVLRSPSLAAPVERTQDIAEATTADRVDDAADGKAAPLADLEWAKLLADIAQDPRSKVSIQVLYGSAADVSIQRLALNDNPDGSHSAVYRKVLGLQMWRELLPKLCEQLACERRDETVPTSSGVGMAAPREAAPTVPEMPPALSLPATLPGSGIHATDNPAAGGRRKGNNCSYCPAFSCRSNDFPEKSARCMSRHASTFDITRLSTGRQVIVKALREYDRTHPDGVNLKSVDLKVITAVSDPAGVDGATSASLPVPVPCAGGSADPLPVPAPLPMAAGVDGAAWSSLPMPAPLPAAGSLLSSQSASFASSSLPPPALMAGALPSAVAAPVCSTSKQASTHLGHRLRMSSLAHGTLLPVFQAMHAGRSGEALDSELRDLSSAIGMKRSEYGGRRAIEAALACRLWPLRFRRVADAVNHYGCSMQTAKVASAMIRKLMAGIPDGGADWL